MCFYKVIFCPASFLWHIFVPANLLVPIFLPTTQKVWPPLLYRIGKRNTWKTAIHNQVFISPTPTEEIKWENRIRKNVLMKTFKFRIRKYVLHLIYAIVPLNITAFHWIVPQRLLNQPQRSFNIPVNISVINSQWTSIEIFHLTFFS